MLLSVRPGPMLWLLGGLVALGCTGETLTLGGTDTATSAADSGSPTPLPTAESVTSGAGAPALAEAGSGHDGRSGGLPGGAPASAGSSGSQAASAGTAGSLGRRRRGGGGGGTTAAAEGGAGMRGLGQSLSQAGTAGRAVRDGRAGSASEGCVQNLACELQTPESTGDVHQDCVDRINQFRQECACLPALARWREGEACADEMAKYDSGGDEAHAAFGDKICDGGSAQNECPGWRSETQIVSVCLQRMWDEGPPPMSDCSGNCFQTYGHFLNMTNQRLTKVACGFHEREPGQIWSVQNFAR